MEAILASLKATAWLSLGATYAAAQYIERIKPQFKKAADKMRELSDDLKSAIKSYRDGDNSGSQPVLLVYFKIRGTGSAMNLHLVRPGASR